jgi:hypothetical protein
MQAMLLGKLKTMASVLILLALVGAAALTSNKLVQAHDAASTSTRSGDEPEKTGAAPRPQGAAAAANAAGERDWRAEFQKIYGLADGEVLKRIAPPYPECRARVFDEKGKVEPPAPLLDTDTTYLFYRFQNNKTVLSTRHGYGRLLVTSPPPGALSFILEMGLRFPLQQVEAPAELLDTNIEGEFVFRSGTSPEKWAPALDRILRTQCKLPLRVKLREVERDVIVLSGDFQSKPRQGQRKNTIVLSPDEPVEDWSGSGIGSFEYFVQFLNKFADWHIVSEVKSPPRGQLWWRHKSGTMTNVQGRNLYTDDAHTPEVILQWVAEQTGLTLTTAKRKVPVLFVDKPSER